MEGGTPHYSAYQFQPLMSSAELLGRFEGERRAFLAGLLAKAKKAKTWFHLDVERAAAELGVPRERVVAALDYLGEKQMLEVRAAGVRLRYRVADRPGDVQGLIDELVGRTRRHEANEIGRLRQVVELVEHAGCQVAKLAEHFGERREACGHCSWCLGGGEGEGGVARLAARQEAEVPPSVLAQVERLRQEMPEAMADPRQVARLLCGVSCPSLSKAKLTRHALFGRLERVPFGKVMAAVGGAGGG